MSEIDELLILSLLCDEGQESEDIGKLYRQKMQEWVNGQNEWLKEYLLMDKVYYDQNYKKLESLMHDSTGFLDVYQKWMLVKSGMESKAKEASDQLENRFIPEELCVVKKELTQPYQKFFDQMYHCFLYMVWTFGDQKNSKIHRYSGNNMREQVQFLNEIILPYGKEWMKKKKASNWYIGKCTENNVSGYEYYRYTANSISVYYRDNPKAEKIGENLWRIKSEEGLQIGNGIYIKYFGVGWIHNLKVDIFQNEEEDIVTDIPLAYIDNLSDKDGISALEECVKKMGKKYYCVSPEAFVDFLNLLEMNRMAEFRKRNKLCPFCGNRIQTNKSICEKHGSLSLI